MTPARGSVGRRLGTITIDQAISSASNVLITILAARILSATAFGLFGIVFLVYVTTQGVSRALVGEPLLVRPEESRQRPGEAIGTGLVLGLGLGLVVVVAGALASIWEAEVGAALIVLGGCTPLLALQDLGRYLGFATQRPSRALGLDVLWLVLVVAAVGGLIVTGHETLIWFLVGWAGSGALAGTLLLWQHRTHRVEPGLAWLRETWPFSWRYAVSFAAAQGGVLAASVALAGILSARALGAVRGALLLYGPVVQLQAASIAAGVSEVSHMTAAGTPVHGPDVRRHIERSTLLTTAMAVVTMGVLLLLPDRLGELVLGDTWQATQRLLVPAGVQMVLVGLISGVRSTLLGVRAVSKTLRIDIATTVLSFGATVGGALAGDVITAFWSLAVAQGVVALMWWGVCLHHMRQELGSAPPAPAPA